MRAGVTASPAAAQPAAREILKQQGTEENYPEIHGSGCRRGPEGKPVNGLMAPKLLEG